MCRINYDLFGFSKVELIFPSELILLELEIVVYESRIYFYLENFCSTQFYVNISKHKPLELKINFDQNQFYIISYIKKKNFSPHNQTYTK
jgi:hypothetical protein